MIWQCASRAGTFEIRLIRDRYHALFEDEDLGSYPTPLQALDDLVGGHTDWPSSGVDPATLDLPDDLSDWDRIR